MSGANPTIFSNPIYSSNYYTCQEFKDLRNRLLDSKEITQNMRDFLRGRTFSRSRGIKRFYTQLQSPERWCFDGEKANIPFGLECSELFYQIFCVPKSELKSGHSFIEKTAFLWRRKINK